MSARAQWRLVFLTLTGLAVGMELWSAYDGNPATDPWTYLLVDFGPAPLTMGAAAVLSVWLPMHLLRSYRDRRRSPA